MRQPGQSPAWMLCWEDSWNSGTGFWRGLLSGWQNQGFRGRQLFLLILLSSFIQETYQPPLRQAPV